MSGQVRHFKGALDINEYESCYSLHLNHYWYSSAPSLPLFWLFLLSTSLQLSPSKNRTSHLNKLFFVHTDKYLFKNIRAKSQENEFEVPGIVIENEYETFSNQEYVEAIEESNRENVTYFCDVSINQQKVKKRFKKLFMTTIIKILYDLSHLQIPVILSSLIRLKNLECEDIQWQGYFRSLGLFFLCLLQTII